MCVCGREEKISTRFLSSLSSQTLFPHPILYLLLLCFYFSPRMIFAEEFFAKNPEENKKTGEEQRTRAMIRSQSLGKESENQTVRSQAMEKYAGEERWKWILHYPFLSCLWWGLLLLSVRGKSVDKELKTLIFFWQTKTVCHPATHSVKLGGCFSKGLKFSEMHFETQYISDVLCTYVSR